jgi:ATP-dependent protease Clp ATPase subunit
MQRETGVRSLRSMFEEVLLDLRFEIGSRKGERVVITGDYVLEKLRRKGGDRRKRDSA